MLALQSRIAKFAVAFIAIRAVAGGVTAGVRPIQNRRASFRRATWAGAEDFERVGDVLITHLPREAFEAVGHAEVERMHAAAGAADDVMVMMLAVVEFVAVGAVAKIAPPQHADFLHRLERAIDRDDVALLRAQLSMQLLGAKRPVLLHENREHRLARFGDAQIVGAQFFNRVSEGGVGLGVMVGHGGNVG